VGQSVTAQYAVAPSSGAGTVSCTATVAVGQCALTFTSEGAKSLTATDAGDSTYNGSTSAAESHQGDKAGTTTVITSDSPDPSQLNAAVTVNYSVSFNAPGAGRTGAHQIGHSCPLERSSIRCATVPLRPPERFFQFRSISASRR
jgi:hypothetical protein